MYFMIRLTQFSNSELCEKNNNEVIKFSELSDINKYSINTIYIVF